MRRASGIIMHIASLPGKYGIGTFGKEAFEFVDFLKKAGQGYWQILPLGPTSYGDSPYQSFSAFAGNPYFIDFDILNKEGLELVDLTFIYDLNQSLGDKGNIKLSSKVGSFKGGFILERNGIQINNTYEALVSSLKDELEFEVANVLFD